MTAGDRMAYMADSEREAAAKVAPAYGGEQGLPTHQDEILASHPGRPTEAEAVGRGVTPASGG